MLKGRVKMVWLIVAVVAALYVGEKFKFMEKFNINL